MSGSTKRGEAIDWMKAHIGFEDDCCLRWPFSATWTGYGQIGINKKIKKAHRVMCEMAHGAPPTPRHIAAHSCHHRWCVNPKHLSWKTPRDNMMDRHEAGTLTKKRWTRSGTLSDDDVATIEAMKGTFNQRQIAAIFGISYQHVSIIQNRKLKRQKERAA